MHVWTPTATNPEQAARDVISAATWMHSTFKNEVWLWRGQADKKFGIEPGMHTRVLDADGTVYKHNQCTVNKATTALLTSARKLQLDRHGSTCLPDLALLAHLQHHGAATPLLDVTTDPLMALWMVVFAERVTPAKLDSKSGLLFGIRRPPKERWIASLDARTFAGESPTVSGSLDDTVWWYRAPDVTERLRIQRASFLLAPLLHPKRRKRATIPLQLQAKNTVQNWVKTRFTNRGKSSNTTKSACDAFAIKVRGSLKPHLRDLLTERSGLTVETVYPTPWHRPLIEQFAVSYGRSRKLQLDLVPD